jgi:hypothetical protein
MPYRERIFGVAAKIEATSGTDSVPTAATDAIRVVGIPHITIDFLESGERDDVQTGQLGRVDRTAPAGRYGRIDLQVEVKGGGAAGAAPEYDVLMRISGHSKTVSAGVSVLYSTLDDNMETATLYLWGEGGKLFKLVGCVATLRMTAEAAKRGYKTFSVTGKMASDPADQVLPALTFNATLPPLFQAGAANIGSWSSASGSEPLVLKSIEVDEQIPVADRASAGAADGLVGYLITDRAVRQTMVVEVPALATFDPYSVAKAAGGTGPTTAYQIGTAVGNRCKVQTGRWSLKAPRGGAINGISTVTLEGGLGIGSAPTSNREINYLYD